MDEIEEKLKILELSHTLRKHYHDALWEEEKHFTWWISIIFPSLILIYANSQLCALQKILIIIPISLFGIFLSYTGFHVVRRESIGFTLYQETFNRTSKALGLHMPNQKLSDIPLMPDYPLNENFEKAKDMTNKSITDLLKNLIIKRTNLGIRDCFQLVFIFSGLLFVLFDLFTFWTLRG